MKFACSSLLRLNLLPSFLSPDGVLRLQERQGQVQEPAGRRRQDGAGQVAPGVRLLRWRRAEEQGLVRIGVHAHQEHPGAVRGAGRAAAAGVRPRRAPERHQRLQPRAQGRRGGLRLRLPRLLPLRRRRPRRPRRQAPQPAQPSGQFASSHLLYSLLFLLFFSPKIIHAMLHFGIRFVMPYRICSSESLNSVTIRLIIVFDHTVAEYLCSIWMESLEIYSDSDLIL